MHHSQYKYLLLFFALLLMSNKSCAINYFVNDASTTGDVYCTAVGNAGNAGTAKNTPKLTLANVLTTYSASFISGDTIFIDAGSYTDKDLSSPANGVVITGLSATKTIFTNPGSDNFFMRIDDNNTVLAKMKLTGFDDMGGGVGQTLGIAASKTGIKIIDVMVNAASQTSTASGYPIDIASGASVTFTGGGGTCSTFDAGGGIRVVGATTNVTITGYQFIGNDQIFSEGTALRVENGTVTVSNSLFDGNKAEGDHHGAAIYVAAGTVNVYDSYFVNNKTNLAANAPGGTILIAGGTFRITRSIIASHTQLGGSTSYGAGIGVTGGTVTIDSCSFSGNIGSRGNDVHNKGGTITARNCTFGSSSTQIGVNTGVANSFSISKCGSPGITITSGSVNQIDNLSPTYTASPSTPSYTGTCASSNVVLPVELLVFDAFCNNGKVKLNWETASESNNNFFTITRALGDEEFKTIAHVIGNGNSKSVKNYQYIDNLNSSQAIYYKLYQTDFDGKEKELSTITIKSCAALLGAFSMNTLAVDEVSGSINVNDDVLLNFNVFDLSGRLIFSNEQNFRRGNNSFNFSVADLATGMYVLKMFDTLGSILEVNKFFKQ